MAGVFAAEQGVACAGQMGALGWPFEKKEKEWESLVCFLASPMASAFEKRIPAESLCVRVASDGEETKNLAGWKGFIGEVRPLVEAPPCIPLGDVDAS